MAGSEVPGSPPDETNGASHIDDSARASGFLAGGNFFEMASRSLIALLLARWLGVDGYGLYVLAVSAGLLFAGVSLLGLDRAMIRYIAIMARREDRVGLVGTIQIGLVFSTIAGVVLGVVLYLAAEPVAVGLFDEPDLVPLLRLMALVVPFLTVSSVLVGIAQGFKRMEYSALAENVIQTIVRLALLALLVALGRLDVVVALIIFGLADVAATVALIILLRKDWLRKNPEPITQKPRRDTREVLAFAFPLWLSGLLRRLRRNIEAILLGTFSVISSVGIYAVVKKINLVGHVSYLAILGGVRPTLAALHDSGERESLDAVYTTATRWTLLVNLPFFLIIVMFPAELLGIFGEDFRAGATALVVLAFAELINAATGVCQSMIDMTGHTKVKLLNSLIWVVLAVTFSALLIPEHGVLGAAISTLIAVASVNFLSIGQVWFLERLSPFDRRSLKPMAAGAASLVVGLVARFMLDGLGEYMALVAVGSLVLIVYVALIRMLGLEDDDRRVITSTTRAVARRLRWREAPQAADLGPEGTQ